MKTSTLGALMTCLGIGIGYFISEQRKPSAATQNEDTLDGIDGERPGSDDESSRETTGLGSQCQDAGSRCEALEQRVAELTATIAAQERLLDELGEVASNLENISRDGGEETGPGFLANHLEPGFLKSLVPARVEAQVLELGATLALSEEQQGKLNVILTRKAEKEVDEAAPFFGIFKDGTDVGEQTKRFGANMDEAMLRVQREFEREVSMVLTPDQMATWRKEESDNWRERAASLGQNQLIRIQAAVPDLNDLQKTEIKRRVEDVYRFSEADIRLGDSSSFGQEIKATFTTGYGFPDEARVEESLSTILTRDQIEKVKAYNRNLSPR